MGTATVRTDDEIKSDDGDDYDDDCALEEVLFLHTNCVKLRRCLPFIVDSGDGRAGNLQNRLVGAADNETGIPNRGDHADHAPGSHDAIANLQVGYRVLKLSLPLLLRPYY